MRCISTLMIANYLLYVNMCALFCYNNESSDVRSLTSVELYLRYRSFVVYF